MDRNSPFVRFQSVDTDDNAHKGRVQRAVRLEIGRHMDAHSEHVMPCLGGKIQTVLRSIQHGAIFGRQARVEGTNARGLRQIDSRVPASFLGISRHVGLLTQPGQLQKSHSQMNFAS